MQKLLSIILGAAVTFNMSVPHHAAAQSPVAGGNSGRTKPLTATIQVDHKISTVHGHQGALTLVVRGGKAPYTYVWSTGSHQSYVNGLAAGRYTGTVVDASGNRYSVSSEIQGLDCSAASCEFRTQTQGGWGANPHGNNPGVYLHANFAAAFPNGLVVGCDNTLTLTSAQAVTDFLPSGSTPRALTADLVDPAGNYDNVLAGQVVALSLSVGFDNYDANFGTSSASLGSLVVASGDFAGMTVQQVLDEANAFLGGCASVYTASQLNDAVSALNENFDDGNQNHNYVLCPQASDLEVSVNATPETCAELCNGTAMAMVSGGNAPYAYLWSNGATTESIDHLCPANYDLTVTDALGCEASANADVNASQAHLLASIAKTDVSCNGAHDGSLLVSIAEGAAPFAYLWNPLVSNNESATNLGAGVYQVHVSDANGCEADLQEEIAEPALLQLQASSQDATCPGVNDGYATVTPSGGTAPYSYLWSPAGGTNATATGLGAGLYNVTVVDAHFCQAAIGVEINLENGNCYSRFGSSENIESSISVYPSVISDDVKIRSTYSSTVEADVTITSVEGKIAFAGHMLLKADSENSVNTSEFAPGIYSMNVMMDNQSHVYKIVKK